MNFEKYTDRARGFVQSAQSLALREGHQQFAPEHLLKVRLDDSEGLAAGLIDRLYVHSPDRLARDFAHQILLIDEFHRAGVEVVFLNHDDAHGGSSHEHT